MKVPATWRSILALGLIITGFFLNLNWLWAILFLLWVIPDFFSGITFLMEPIPRKEHPILYWAILGTWLFLSGYMLVDVFLPNQLPTTWRSTAVYAAVEEGEYIFTAPNDSLQWQENDTLFYKEHLSPAFDVVGITALTTTENNAMDSVVASLWERLEKEEILTKIPHVLDKHIYVIQSDFDVVKKGYFQVTLGCKVGMISDLPEGLTAVKVQASKYAVIELDQQPLEQLMTTWYTIAWSDLPETKLNNVEVYYLDDNYEKINKIDVWIALPTSKAALVELSRSTPVTQPTENSSTAPLVTTEKVGTPYNAPAFDDDKNQTTAAVESVAKSDYPVVQHKALTVVGLQTVVDYTHEKTLSQATEQLWTQFFSKNYAKHIKSVQDYEKLYLTYTNYKENTVVLTLGYATTATATFRPNKGLHKVQIASNDFHRFITNKSTTSANEKEWNTLMEVLQYRSEESSDFEVYTFDKQYNITDAQMWIGAK